MIKLKKIIIEGDIRPKFYFPIRAYDYDRYRECWVFPLCFLVISWYILINIIHGVWSDLNATLRLLRR